MSTYWDVPVEIILQKDKSEQSMSETEKETFRCDKCGKAFDSESQMNAHKVSVHSVAGGEITMR
jgi:phage terminase large subunit